jgi:hypothetical protein
MQKRSNILFNDQFLSRLTGAFFGLVFVLTLGACSTIPLPLRSESSAAALALLEATQQAHGKDSFAAIKDIAVSYDGKWYTLVTKIQPLVTDPQFRGSSEERMILDRSQNRLVAQTFKGPSGTKLVVKRASKSEATGAASFGEVAIAYNGKQNQDDAVNAATHLVLEAYQLFLYPAFYVQRATWFETAGTAFVNGYECDLLLAVMRPGIGASKEDRVMLYIDKKERLVRRTRLTLEGTATTRGAVVDTDLSDFVTIAGVKWPSKFYEDLVTPFRGLPAHLFWLTGLDVNRGLTNTDFINNEFSAKAGIKAAPLPQK